MADIRKDKSWQSKAWILERRFPERWAKRENTPPEVEQHKGVICVPMAGQLTPEELLSEAAAMEPKK